VEGEKKEKKEEETGKTFVDNGSTGSP